MTGTHRVWRHTRARIVAGGMTIALASVPLAAADPSSAPVITLKAAVEKAAATEPLAARTTTPAQPAQPEAAMAPESKSFFKTGLGLAVIAIVGTGTAYALYSAQHDRIHSSAR